MLRELPSGDLFGWTQNAGMGWNPLELGGKEFLILSTHGGVRAPDGSPVALGYLTGHWEVGLLVEAAARELKAAGAIPFAGCCTDPCDGRSQGTPAMFDSLPYRNDAATVFRRLICSLPTRRGVLGIATCDKGLPAMMMALAAMRDIPSVLVPGGWPVAFTARVACPSFFGGNGVDRMAMEGLDDLEYAIPNVLMDFHRADAGIPTYFWRSVGYSQNTFFGESFLDELAAAGGKDPVEFRRRLLANSPRLLGVLNLAAEKAGWGKPPAGRFQGVALVNNIGSYNAQVADVSVDRGKLRVHRVVCAVDCGRVVNPAIVRQQIESGIVFGLSAAMKGAITIDRGRVQQSNFHDYDVLGIDEMPQIDVHIVASENNPGGIGEASVPPIAPAVTNAIFKATGKRIRRLPIRTEELV
jgi:hypothetical protein